MKISAIIITRNEQDTLKECIGHLGFTDEIVVVDNKSTDSTVALAKSMGAKVYEVSGLNFSYFRNVGKEKGSGEWLLYIDADEHVTKELAQEIVKKLEDPGCVAYSLPRKNYFLGSPWPLTEHMVRLIRKDALIGWQGIVHETPQIVGNIGAMEHLLLHFTHRNLSSMIAKTNEWSDIEAQLYFKSDHPSVTWWRFFRILATGFWNSYIRQGSWKVGTVGLIESIYQSFSMFVTYAKLWEKQNRSRLKHEEIR